MQIEGKLDSGPKRKHVEQNWIITKCELFIIANRKYTKQRASRTNTKLNANLNWVNCHGPGSGDYVSSVDYYYY